MKKGKFIYNNQELQWTSDGRVRVVDDRDPELQEYIDCFKKYVEKLNDNVFIAAVEMFPNVANITMHDFALLLEGDNNYGKICSYITLFKNCVQQNNK